MSRPSPSWRPGARVLILVALGASCDLGHLDPPTVDPSVTGPSSGCSGACHGVGDQLAPPRDTAGRSDLASIGVGAHTQHLQASDWHKRFACETCHVVPAQVGDVGHIFTQGAAGLEKDPLPAELVFTGLGTSATWDHDTATCSTSYCHGDTLHQVDPMTNQIVMGAGGTITKPSWTQVDGTQSACGACHGTPPPAPHPQNEDCGQCHPSMNPGDFAAKRFSYPELHIDGVVEVSGALPCDSCHGGGGNPAPPRDAHKQTATSAPGVGAHAQHMTTSSTWHAPIACNECHLVPGSSTDQTHLDNLAEVFLDPTIKVPGSQLASGGTGGVLQIPGATWNAEALTCAGTYCHGGNQSPLKGGAASTPTWTQVDGTQAKCQSCHGMPPPAPHPVDSDCGKCHPTMTAGDNQTITYPAKHLDGNVDVIGDRPCDSCHGAGGNPAPPLDTTGGTSTDLRGVGAHQRHLQASTWHADVTCDQCHKVPAAMESIGHIDSPLPAEIIFGNLAGPAAAWNGTTCSNVYCHGATLKDGSGAAGGNATKPVWTTVNGAQSQCGSCHGTPPPPPHPVDSDCGKCHPTMTPGGGLVITDPTRHIDGNLDVVGDQACNSCHGGANNAPPKDTAGNTATTARGVGAHQRHLSPTSPIGKAVVCLDCHRVPATVSSLGHIDTPLPAEVSFSGRAGSAPSWNGAQCTNVYCHGATLTDGSTGAGGTATSPLWQRVDGSQQQCTSCHGFPPPAPHPQDSNCGTCHLDVKPGSNQVFLDVTKHIDGNLDVTGDQACNSCHGGANNAPPKDVNGGTQTTLRGVGAHQAHLGSASWHRTIACGECHVVPATVGAVGHLDTPLPAELTFTGIGAGGTWNGASCSTYCHGATLKTSAGTPAGGAQTAPLWTKVDGSQAQCTSCHGAPPPPPHPANSACDSCHMDAGPGQTIKTPALHIDGTVHVTAGRNHPPGYNAREQHGYDFDKTGSSTCATAGCHGVALTGGSTGGPSCNSCHTANWQSDCKFCHGTSADGAPPQGVLGQTAATDPHVGAHAKHVGATATHAAWSCSFCHTQPSGALTPGHIDGTGGVVQAEVRFSSLNPSSVFSTTSNTCTSSYCHGSGAGAKTSPAWTSTQALGCVDGCHGGDPNRTGMSSNHRRGDHRVPCATCHKSVVNGNNIINPALHVNGVKNVAFAPAGSSYNAATKSCTGTGNGCHGSGTMRGW
ncbi:MAG: CxxxxCH/CxxCH domain-containing protein [Kofleriaceae bacterium]